MFQENIEHLDRQSVGLFLEQCWSVHVMVTLYNVDCCQMYAY